MIYICSCRRLIVLYILINKVVRATLWLPTENIMGGNLLKNSNPLPVKLSYLTFYPPKVVSRYRDPQIQVGEN